MRNNFRVVIPRKVDSFLTLVGNILAKHTADGVNSLLTPLNMADMQAKYTTATTRHAQAGQFDRDKETAFEQRNAALGIMHTQQSYTPNTVLYYVTSIRDHLLGVFKGTEQLLGDWTFTVNLGGRGTSRVVVPRNAERLIGLAKGILAKHEADEEETLLGSFDMAAFANLTEEAETQHELAQKLSRDKESANQVRNKALGYGTGQKRGSAGTLLTYVVAVREVLVGNHKGTEQLLGDWGFEVNTSLPTNPTPDPITAMVQGIVTNASTSVPIGGVRLVFATSAGDTELTTDPAGNYAGEVELEAPETVMVEIAHVGFLPLSEAHSLTPDLVHVINFGITPVPIPD
ncbi:MAG: hypothetical protein M0R38_01535 [Bacteroidia bacterium]|nr:hypothetical protein [Bacteroidia bacterium]